jgi:hypothetical protein
MNSPAAGLLASTLALCHFVPLAALGAPLKNHVRVEIVLMDGGRKHLVPGRVKIESSGDSATIDTGRSGFIERDLVCDLNTRFAAQPLDPLLEPAPPSMACTEASNSPPPQIRLISLQVRAVELADIWKKSGDAANLKFASMPMGADATIKLGYLNLDKALNAGNTAAAAHIATELASIFRGNRDSARAEFLSGIAFEALGTQLGVERPLIYDPRQFRMVPTEDLFNASTTFASAKGLGLPPANQNKINGQLMNALSGLTSEEVMANEFDPDQKIKRVDIRQVSDACSESLNTLRTSDATHTQSRGFEFDSLPGKNVRVSRTGQLVAMLNGYDASELSHCVDKVVDAIYTYPK